MSNAFAIVVGIENYSQAGINPVNFAREDATAFAAALHARMDVPNENIKVWLDSDANQVNFKEELKYEVKGLKPDDRFYFFYAGHGLFANGKNRLVAWDSHPRNFTNTTVILDEVLLTPLRESGCKHCAIFVDACAAEFDSTVTSRDVLSNMDKREFQTFIGSSEYSAAFFACNANEKSYSLKSLGHGIWTYHLLRALNGDEPDAIARDRFVTGESLQNYLALAIPKYIRENTKITGRQTPYALIGASGSFALAHLPEPPTMQPSIAISPDYAGASFRRVETRPFRKLPGFNRKNGHFEPTYRSDKATAFAGDLLQEEIAKEIQAIYSRAKSVLDLKSREVKTNVSNGGGSVDTDTFRFALSVDQSSTDPANVTIEREISLRVSRPELPDNFDEIFPTEVNELVIPIPGSDGSFSVLVDAFEDIAGDIGAQIDDDPIKGKIELTLSDGTNIIFWTQDDLMIVSHPRSRGCVGIIDHLDSSDVVKLIGDAPKMIGIQKAD
jgi:hypothetical protein